MNKRTLVASMGICLTAALQPGAVLAQGYPTKPIRMVVPYDPGGISDLSVRMIQPRMEALLGQAIVVENHPGAGGLVGTEAVAKAPTAAV